MHRSFIAALVTATLFITSFAAAPARADNRDLARVLAGIAALAVIGKAISDRNDDDRVAKTAPVTRHRNIAPRPLPRRAARHALPVNCERRLRTRDGNLRRMFGARCLERHYQYANDLPRSCARQVELGRDRRWAYGARCLRKNGFTVAQY